MKLKDNEIILFQGDSITDGARGRTLDDPNHFIGHSFPYLICAELSLKYLDKNPVFYSRGCSGDDSLRMYARWREDTIKLNPTIINVLIGTNDSMRFSGDGAGTSLEQFENILNLIVNDTKKELKNTELIFCEPFYFDLDNSDLSKKRIEDTFERQKIVKSVADKYGFLFVPMQNILEEYAEKVGNKSKILWDGVHPTLLGHSILNRQWFEYTKL